jgi:hypothetical protein
MKSHDVKRVAYSLVDAREKRSANIFPSQLPLCLHRNWNHQRWDIHTDVEEDVYFFPVARFMAVTVTVTTLFVQRSATFPNPPDVGGGEDSAFSQQCIEFHRQADLNIIDFSVGTHAGRDP